MSDDSEIDAIDILLDEGVVAYQRGLARAVGDATAGLLLSQFWYWSKRLPEVRDGWFFKTQQEIYEETVLSRREQETARRTLRELGILEESKRGVPSKLWFRINRLVVKRLLQNRAGSQNGGSGGARSGRGNQGRGPEQGVASQDGGKRHPSMAENAIQGCADAPTKSARIRPANTKTTPESTSQITAAASRTALGTAAAGDPELVEALLAQDVNHADARRLARDYPEECRRQLDYLAYLPPRENPGGWLREAIEKAHGAPRAYRETREREEQEARQARTALLKIARQSHEAAHRAAYFAYLEQRVGELRRMRPEAIVAFEAREAEDRARYERAPLTPTMRERVLREHERRENYLERLQTFLSGLPGCAILDFWNWDATLNPHPFPLEESTPGNHHNRNHQPEGGRGQNDDGHQPGGRAGEGRAPGARP